MTFVHLSPVHLDIFLCYRAAAVYALFLFITFERYNKQIIIGLTRILA